MDAYFLKLCVFYESWTLSYFVLDNRKTASTISLVKRLRISSVLSFTFLLVTSEVTEGSH